MDIDVTDYLMVERSVALDSLVRQINYAVSIQDEEFYRMASAQAKGLRNVDFKSIVSASSDIYNDGIKLEMI